jgi:hypothetical protein
MKEVLTTLPLIGEETYGCLECKKVDVELIQYENDFTLISTLLSYPFSPMLIQKSALI